MQSSARDPSMGPVDGRVFRFRLGWGVDASAGSRLLSRRRAISSAAQDDAAAFEAHLRRPERQSQGRRYADERT
jgi:hypothetical protein